MQRHGRGMVRRSRSIRRLRSICSSTNSTPRIIIIISSSIISISSSSGGSGSGSGSIAFSPSPGRCIGGLAGVSDPAILHTVPWSAWSAWCAWCAWCNGVNTVIRVQGGSVEYGVPPL